MFSFSNDQVSKVTFKVLNSTDDTIFIIKLISNDFDINETKKTLLPNYTHLMQLQPTLFNKKTVSSTSIYLFFTDQHGKTHKFLVYENLKENTYVYTKITILKSKLGDYEISLRDLISHPEC